MSFPILSDLDLDLFASRFLNVAWYTVLPFSDSLAARSRPKPHVVSVSAGCEACGEDAGISGIKILPRRKIIQISGGEQKNGFHTQNQKGFPTGYIHSRRCGSEPSADMRHMAQPFRTKYPFGFHRDNASL